MFKVAGVSRFNDGVKVRFANDLSRVKILVKNGHTDIELIELPEAMDKPAVVKFLLKSELMQNPAFAEAITEADEKYNPAPKVIDEVKNGNKDAPKKETKKPKQDKKPKGTVSMEELQARVAAAKEPEAAE